MPITRSDPEGRPRYSEEVLNASWLPQTVLTAREAEAPAAPAPGNSGVKDPETFLQRLYRAQE